MSFGAYIVWFLIFWPGAVLTVLASALSRWFG